MNNQPESNLDEFAKRCGEIIARNRSKTEAAQRRAEEIRMERAAQFPVPARIDFREYGFASADDVPNWFEVNLNKAKTVNATEAKDDGTGVICQKCKNRGYFAKFSAETGWNVVYADCDCAGERTTMRRMRRLGLLDLAHSCTFSSFRRDTATQKAMYTAAMAYVQDFSGHWFIIGGQTGAGKTHICVAAFVEICRRNNIAGEYMQWNKESRRMKGLYSDEQDAAYKRLKEAEILYIDDMGQGGFTEADRKLLFEILNHRLQGCLPTIISSEYTQQQLADWSETIFGRMNQMTAGGKYIVGIKADKENNYRMNHEWE